MAAEIFFKDKGREFACKILVEGADLSKTKARLVLKFPKENINLLYYGTIDENSNFTVDIPALREIKSSQGEALLEVIADETFFESWSGDIELKASKSVKVEMITKEKAAINEAPKVVITMQEKIIPVKTEEPIIEKTKTKIDEKLKPLTSKQKLMEMFKLNRASISKDKLKDFFPSYTATQISENYKLNVKDNVAFQYFLDKNIRPSKLNKIKNLIK